MTEYTNLLATTIDPLKYWGVDWMGSACYVATAWLVATNPYKAQYFALVGSLLGIVFAFQVLSVANLCASVMFAVLYLRAIFCLKSKTADDS